MARNFRLHFLSFLSMLVGTLFIFTAVVFINKYSGRLKIQDRPRMSSVEFTKKTKPIQQKKRVKKKVKKRKLKRASRPVPPPMLNSSISGVEVNIPQLDLDTDFDRGMGKMLNENLANDMIMTSDAVDNAPEPTQAVAPEYPRKERALGITGFVTFNLLIDEQGNVKRAQILNSDPTGVFDQVAFEAIMQWKFRPGMYQGRAVKVWAKQKIAFRLK